MEIIFLGFFFYLKHESFILFFFMKFYFLENSEIKLHFFYFFLVF